MTFELKCSVCQAEFKAASLLLQHFATHAAKKILMASTSKKTLPKLYPIKRKTEESDSGIEDVNPITYCEVTMKESAKTQPKKYQCNYCLKKFGWSTDLKRHIMTHTGERPFLCQKCDSSFTRNFLLLKHNKKCHGEHCIRPKMMPELKPIKSRKQAKTEIKRVKPDGCEGLINNYSNK